MVMVEEDNDVHDAGDAVNDVHDDGDAVIPPPRVVSGERLLR